MTEKSSLIDSNILIYYLDLDEKEKHDKAVDFIQERLIGKDTVVSVQNLAEFSYNMSTNKTIPSIEKEIEDTIREMIDVFEVIFYSPLTIIRANELQKEYKIHFWDALIVATMQENHISIIYTEDTKDFERIPGIKAINPFTDE
ncbi:MAG: PIN domain-containing protein [archaeon]